MIDNLEKNNLQAFIWKSGNKKGYFNKKYFSTKETFTNTPYILDFKEITHWTKQDAFIGIALKNGNIREKNNGVICLDFDLKGKDNITVFDDIIETLKKEKYWKQVERKRNGKGYHLFLKMTPEDMAEVVLQGRIHRGKESFVEVMTAGKFIRLCPNDDYIIDDTEGKSVDFGKLENIPLDLLKSFSKDENDRLLQKKRIYRLRKTILKKDITFVNPEVDFKTEEENLLYSYIKSHMDYDDALRLSVGLGYAKYKDVFYGTIPEEALPTYENIFLKAYSEPYRITSFMKTILGSLKVKKKKSEIIRLNYNTDYLPNYVFDDIRKQGNQIIFNSPTGTGKTTALLHYCKAFSGTYSENEVIKNIIVVPTRAIANQIGEKEPSFNVINCDTSTRGNGVVKRLVKALALNVPNIVITHETFKKNIALFLSEKNTTFFIDEAHKIICSNEGETSVISHFKNGSFEKIVFLSATTFKLEQILPEVKTVYATTTKKYDITLDIFDGKATHDNMTDLILKLLKNHGKVLVHLQDKGKGEALKEHFKAYRSFIYNSDSKEVEIHNEKINKGWDLIICTGSLTEGVSLRDNYYSLFVTTSYDNYDSIVQFVARNRNQKSFGGIFTKLREFDYSFLDEAFENMENYELNEGFTSAEVRISKNYNKNLMFSSMERLMDSLNPDFKYNPVEIIEDPEEDKTGEKKKTLTLDEQLKLWEECKPVRNFSRNKYGRVVKLITDYFSKKTDDKLKHKNIEYIINNLGIQPKGSRTTRDYRRYLADSVLRPHTDTIERLMKSERFEFIKENVLEKINVDFSPLLGKEYKKKSEIKNKVIFLLSQEKLTEYSARDWEKILESKDFKIFKSSRRIQDGNESFFKVRKGE